MLPPVGRSTVRYRAAAPPATPACGGLAHPSSTNPSLNGKARSLDREAFRLASEAPSFGVQPMGLRGEAFRHTVQARGPEGEAPRLAPGPSRSVPEAFCLRPE